jgi:methyl-accepting chemotaxis protein
MNDVSEQSTMLAHEYVPEVKVAAGVERWSQATMYEMRGYGLTAEKSFLDAGMQNLGRIKEQLEEAGALAESSPHLVKLPGAVAEVSELVERYEAMVQETRAVNAKMTENRKQLDAAAGRYMDSAYAFLGGQEKKLGEEIEGISLLLASQEDLMERNEKVGLVNDIIDAGNEVRLAAWRAQAERNPERIRGADAIFGKIDELFARLRGITREPEDLKLLQATQDAAHSYQAAMSEYLANWLQNNELAAKRDSTGRNVLAKAQDLAAAGVGHAERIADNAVSALESASMVMIVGLLAALVVGAVLAYLVTRSITGPVVRGVALAGEIAKGDFTQRLNMSRNDEIGELSVALDRMADGLKKNADLAERIAAGDLDVDVVLASEKDQLGRALQNMTRSLNEILGQVQVAGEQIATGSSQVSDSSQSLSQGATESASSLEEITSSMAEMASQTRLNAENATQASTLSGEARKAAESGNKQMKQMVAAMGEINEAGQSISKIIKVIDEIAFQTNLLALNAAVEAARAGQHGKGFAVVAEEVRNLAARSAKAASETAELIEGSVKKAENGADIADRTAAALEEIVSGITRATDLVGEIAAASNEQAQGIGQVNQGLGQIDQVTQQNTANAEESAAASEELSGQAEELRRLLTRFRLKEGTGQALKPGAGVSKPRSFEAAAPLSSPPREEARTWGDNGDSPAVSGVARPEEVIALDDDEFGKY